MSICERYGHFPWIWLTFPTLCRLVRKISFWTFIKKWRIFGTCMWHVEKIFNNMLDLLILAYQNSKYSVDSDKDDWYNNSKYKNGRKLWCIFLIIEIIWIACSLLSIWITGFLGYVHSRLPLQNGVNWTVESSKWVFNRFFIIDFSLLSMSEFLNREMETYETINHLLCGWCSKLLYKKSPFRYNKVVQANI